MKIYRLLTLAVILLLAVAPVADARRVNLTASGGGFLTISAGTPFRLAVQKTLVDRLFIQARHSNVGVVYVMLGVPTSATCSASNAAHLTAELGAGTATQPGGDLSDPQGANGNTPSDREDLALACIDGTNTGDQVIVSYWTTN